MPTQALPRVQGVDFSEAAFKDMALTALSQFGRVPETVHYYAVGALYRRMCLLTRDEIEKELQYWRGVLQKLRMPRAMTYRSFGIYHALEEARAPIGEVARHGNRCRETHLISAREICQAMT